MYLFSKSLLAFFPIELIDDYTNAGTLPNDVIEVSDDVRNMYNSSPPAGQKLGADKNGLPIWVDVPPLSTEELKELAEIKKSQLIDDANATINRNNWSSKLALGRLSDNDKKQFNWWLDYIDAVDAIDTSAASIQWPVNPA